MAYKGWVTVCAQNLSVHQRGSRKESEQRVWKPLQKILLTAIALS